MNYFQKILGLQQTRPRMALSHMNCVNSEYTMYCADLKNCYLLIGSERDEDCLYGNWVYESRDCCDSDFIFKCERCYGCVDCEGCYNCDFCQDCTTCMDSEYCYDCKACKNCFGCVGLRNKQFHILNKPYSKEAYAAKIKTLRHDPDFQKEFGALKRSTPRLFAHVMNNESCTGDYLYHSKNSFVCFDGKKLEDSLYMQSSIECRDCIDMSNSYFGCELSYEVMSSIKLYNCNFSNFCFYSRDLEYCEWCFHCQDCFGSFYLQHKQYFIFNEPYAKEAYFKKVAEIKDAMRRDGTYGKHLPLTIKLEDSAIWNYFPKTKATFRQE